MARRRTRDDNGVSLFPFMSILACLIGILTLMISLAMVAKEMDRRGRTQEELDLATENRDLQKDIVKIQEEKKALDETMDKERNTVTAMRKLRDRKIVLNKDLEEIKKAKDPAKTDAELQKIAENLKDEIASLKNERPSLAIRLKELEKELKSRKEQPKPQESVLVRPGGVGSRSARNVFFVECNSTGITIMEEDKPPLKVSKAAIGTNGQYNQFLQRVKTTRDSMVLFLVRKSGNDSYLWAAGWAESKYQLKIGKLPVPNDGKIDLSLFNN